MAATVPNCFLYDTLSSLNATERLAQVGRLVPLTIAGTLLEETGRNVNSYGIFVGEGDTGRAVASSYYIHNEPIEEHTDYCPLKLGEDFRDPPLYIAREGHASQSPEGLFHSMSESANFKAYDELSRMGLTLEQQEYGKKNQGSTCFPVNDSLTSVRSRLEGKRLWTPECALIPTTTMDQLA